MGISLLRSLALSSILLSLADEFLLATHPVPILARYAHDLSSNLERSFLCPHVLVGDFSARSWICFLLVEYRYERPAIVMLAASSVNYCDIYFLPPNRPKVWYHQHLAQLAFSFVGKTEDASDFFELLHVAFFPTGFDCLFCELVRDLFLPSSSSKDLVPRSVPSKQSLSEVLSPRKSPLKILKTPPCKTLIESNSSPTFGEFLTYSA